MNLAMNFLSRCFVVEARMTQEVLGKVHLLFIPHVYYVIWSLMSHISLLLALNETTCFRIDAEAWIHVRSHTHVSC